ncbi:MAG TPA: hypothetical protein VMN36_15745 [Verrucomicrobiales bacterium]|nr:hypothetical protein [Verrucomicrobiales bacterium]
MSTDKDFEALWSEAQKTPQKKVVEARKVEVNLDIGDVLDRYFAAAPRGLTGNAETREAFEGLIQQSERLRSVMRRSGLSLRSTQAAKAKKKGSAAKKTAKGRRSPR